MATNTKNKARYPKNWPSIARRIKEQAGWRCQGSSRYGDCTAEHGKPHPVTGAQVVLAVHHRDGNPANCAENNLVALCQRCHTSDDATMHARNSAQTQFLKAQHGYTLRLPPEVFRD